MGADIALFPEMWSNGSNIYNRPVEEWKAEAVSADSDFVNAFRDLAEELCMDVGITILEKHDADPRNTMILFDRFGDTEVVLAAYNAGEGNVRLWLAENNGASLIGSIPYGETRAYVKRVKKFYNYYK